MNSGMMMLSVVCTVIIGTHSLNAQADSKKKRLQPLRPMIEYPRMRFLMSSWTTQTRPNRNTG